MPIKNTFKKVAGLFVEIEEDQSASMPSMTDAEIMQALRDTPSPAPTAKPAPKTVEQIVESSPGPNLNEIKPSPADEKPEEPVITQDGEVNFSAIYKMAALPVEAFSAESVLEVLASLPPELPNESKRATLKVTLDAMSKTTGASVERVISDASRKLAALSAYVEGFEQQANKFVSLAEQDIAKLENQIAERKKSISEAQSRAQTLSSACEAESERLDDVLEFFTLDIGPSKFASDKPAGTS